MIDYATAEEEQADIDKAKQQITYVLQGLEPNHILIYALLEVAAKIAHDMNSQELFEEVSSEVNALMWCDDPRVIG